MSRLSYTRALDNLLFPLGFERQKNMWTRISGDIRERVNLQKSWVDGSVTVNLWADSVETLRIIETIPCKHELGLFTFGQRISGLVAEFGGLDRWWKNNPDGPREVASLVETYALPWFCNVITLEDQARHWYGRGYTGTWGKPNLAAQVVTLYRLGELDEALSMFDEAIPRMANPVMVEKARCIQRWVEDQIRQRGPPNEKAGSL